MRIDQLVPAFHRGDAIGDTALHTRDYLRGRGHSSEIYSLDRDKELEGEGRPFEEFPPAGDGDVTILHFALPSPLTAALAPIPDTVMKLRKKALSVEEGKATAMGSTRFPSDTSWKWTNTSSSSPLTGSPAK